MLAKSIRASFIAVALMTAALLSTAIATAAPVLDKNFNAFTTSGDEAVLQIKGAYSVEKLRGMIAVTVSNGTRYMYADDTGVLYNTLMMAPEFNSSFFQIQGTLLHMNVLNAMFIQCRMHSTTFFYVDNTYRSFADNCANFNAIKASSN